MEFMTRIANLKGEISSQRFDLVLFDNQYIADEPEKQRRGKITLKAGNLSNSSLERSLISLTDISVLGSLNVNILA